MAASVRTLDLGPAKRAALGILLAIACVEPSLAEEGRFTMSFHGPDEGAGALTAVAVACGDGSMLVAVALRDADISKAVVQLDGKPVRAKFAGYDPVSRLCFFKRIPAIPAIPMVWLPKIPEKPGTELRSGEVIGKTQGWVKRIGGKVLPLALMKVEFGGKPPVAGTPLVDAQGRVAAVFFQKSEEANCGYAIPAEAVQRVLRDVEKGGPPSRGYLGVTLKVQNEQPQIVRVFADSPAEDAGIRQDDMISRIGSRSIVDYADVANAFFYLVPGQPVDVTVKRGAEHLDFTLVPSAERPK